MSSVNIWIWTIFDCRASTDHRIACINSWFQNIFLNRRNAIKAIFIIYRSCNCSWMHFYEIFNIQFLRNMQITWHTVIVNDSNGYCWLNDVSVLLLFIIVIIVYFIQYLYLFFSIIDKHTRSLRREMLQPDIQIHVYELLLNILFFIFPFTRYRPGNVNGESLLIFTFSTSLP